MMSDFILDTHSSDCGFIQQANTFFLIKLKNHKLFYMYVNPV